MKKIIVFSHDDYEEFYGDLFLKDDFIVIEDKEYGFRSAINLNYFFVESETEREVIIKEN